ncbi:heavy metal-associated isoprenylated plant protein 20-like isoform X1 [Musa acuminata AAA Group]|uniref:heavy metal-associated isoprenylated plant protein 20-like isoform X1 n=1 Tax=Musa acuminata AAA Group TaxID=214697 RepID=UPI0031D55CDC
MGAFDHLSDFCSVTETRRALQIRKRKPLQTVDLKVKMDCDGCERRVKHAVSSIRACTEESELHSIGCIWIAVSGRSTDIHHRNWWSGVTNVNVNRKQSRVTVTGHIEAKEVVRKIKSTGKRAEAWPYVPYSLVAYPYVAGAYDKKAPAGFVRNVAQAVASPSAPEEKISSLFSDENPNACTVM